MSTKIGYFVPEFPGQTHIFFWREITRLEQQGAELFIISTRKPPQKITSHTWSELAKNRTHYLLDGLGVRSAFATLTSLLFFSPAAWRRCLRSISEGRLPLRNKLELACLMMFGARLARIAKLQGWAHVHVHSCAHAANIAMFAHLLSGLPYSLTLHGPLADYGPNQREKWRHAAFGIVITQKLFAALRAELGPAVPANLQIAPMGVNLDVFQRATPYQAWDGRGSARLYSIGRLNPCKGHADLIEAVALLKARGLRIKLKIAGEDESGGSGYHLYLQRLIEERGLAAEVQLLGAVSEQVIRDGLTESHVFALASLQEPLGVAIMEAMALEVPVVVTSGGGVRELVDDGRDGVLVEPQNVPELAAALERVLQQPALCAALAQASRKKIVEQFHDGRSAQLLWKLSRKPQPS